MLHDHQTEHTNVSVFGGSGENIPGRDLLPIEEQTRAEACRLVQKYLKGDLKPSGWEERDLAGDGPMAIMDCPACQGHNSSCGYCSGRGKVAVRRADRS
jgi:hypothetical protein